MAAVIGGLLLSASGAAIDFGGGTAAARSVDAGYVYAAAVPPASALRREVSATHVTPRPSRSSAAARPAIVAKVFTRPTAPARVQAAQAVRSVEAATIPADYGCGPALAYLASHAAPGFRFQCPGYALGHQAMTCQNVAGVCPGGRLIVIHIPCAAAYMNEAYNSWIVEGLRSGSYDPYGYCH